ncbi:unnamed protein product [Caenorhabditis bovis]|uniref:Uncharacterized protein n=1 Tax=Caenorhabditis bovis TaxID=2654633 RepID=A0A8S1E7A8_9PELO|nr:unnamed protein product [Caenorhabditis bovis]
MIILAAMLTIGISATVFTAVFTEKNIRYPLNRIQLYIKSFELIDTIEAKDFDLHYCSGVLTTGMNHYTSMKSAIVQLTVSLRNFPERIFNCMITSFTICVNLLLVFETIFSSRPMMNPEWMMIDVHSSTQRYIRVFIAFNFVQLLLISIEVFLNR